MIRNGIRQHTLPVILVRRYVSRAHPPKTSPPGTPVMDALEQLMKGLKERREKRVLKWNRNADVRQKKGVIVRTKYIKSL